MHSLLLRLDGHIVGIVLTLGAVPLDGELRDAKVQGVSLQRLQGILVGEHIFRCVHQVLDGVFAVRRLVGQHDGGLIEVGELLLQVVGESAERGWES